MTLICTQRFFSHSHFVTVLLNRLQLIIVLMSGCVTCCHQIRVIAVMPACHHYLISVVDEGWKCSQCMACPASRSTMPCRASSPDPRGSADPRDPGIPTVQLQDYSYSALYRSTSYPHSWLLHQTVLWCLQDCWSSPLLTSTAPTSTSIKEDHPTKKFTPDP